MYHAVQVYILYLLFTECAERFSFEMEQGSKWTAGALYFANAQLIKTSNKRRQ